MTGYAGIIYSFAGIWFGGHVTMPEREDVQLRTLDRKILACNTVNFQSCDYRAYSPTGSIIYCDPPYLNTAGYSIVDYKFDHIEFWNIMRDWSKNNMVIISEQQAPDDFPCIAEFASRLNMTKTKTRPARVERLFSQIR